MHMCINAHMQRSEEGIWYCAPLLSALLSWDKQSRTRLGSQQALVILSLPPPGYGFRGLWVTMPKFLCGFCGFEFIFRPMQQELLSDEPIYMDPEFYQDYLNIAI